MPRQSRRLSPDEAAQRAFGNVDPAALDALERLNTQVVKGLGSGLTEIIRLQTEGDPESVRIAAFRALASEADLKSLIRHAMSVKVLVRDGALGSNAEDALVNLFKDFPQEVVKRAMEKAFATKPADGFPLDAHAAEVDGEAGEGDEEEGIDLSALAGL